MKKLTVFLCVCLCAVSIIAQTQQGYVKTLGRPNQKGQALSGVTIRVKGGHNAVLSSVDGTFALTLTGKKLGESYQLQQVQKQGYELKDKGAVGRQYAYSDKVPLVLVMQSRQYYQEEKQRIENSIYAAMEHRYQSDVERLEQQKASNQLAIEQYRQQLQQLQQNFERIQGLVEGLADHYALVDYDELNDKEREINLAIETGQLERADSLLQQLGVQQRAQDIAQRLQAGQQLKAEAQQDMAAILKQQEKDAEHLYQLYTIALSRYDNDKARFYIETRAELDTTNVEWQNGAGRFMDDYVADYPKALSYFQRCVKLQITMYGEYDERTAVAYNSIGFVYEKQGAYDKALDYYNKALNIWLLTIGNMHPYVGFSYNNIGNVYSRQGQYDKALKYHLMALDVREKSLGKEHNDVAQSYNNIGYIYAYQQHYDKALKCFKKAVSIMEKLLDKDDPNLAITYTNIGFIYSEVGQYDQAWEYFDKTLPVFEKIYGKEHPQTAQLYYNLGNIYGRQGNYDKALEYMKRTKFIYETKLGVEHPYTLLAAQQVIICDAEAMKEYVFVGTVMDGDNPARQQGMEGEYIMLEFADWNIESRASIFYKNDEYYDKAKSIVVMKDGAIFCYHFEKSIGVQFALKKIEKEEKLHIISEYKKWKNNQ